VDEGGCTNFASVDVLPNYFVVTVFDENGILVDSVSFGNYESKESVDRALRGIEFSFNIERWISSEERKIIERQ